MPAQEDNAARLAVLLAEIVAAEAAARLHDRIKTDRDIHAEAAQRADEAAEAPHLKITGRGKPQRHLLGSRTFHPNDNSTTCPGLCRT